jgi:hypothetical protein
MGKKPLTPEQLEQKRTTYKRWHEAHREEPTAYDKRWQDEHTDRAGAQAMLPS